MATPLHTTNELDPDRIGADVETLGQLDGLGEAADKIEEAENKLAEAISLLNEAGLCVSDNGRLYEAAEQLGSILKDDIRPARASYGTAHSWAADDLGVS